MYKHILIATDGSELAGRALAHGLALAKGQGGGHSGNRNPVMVGV